MMRTVCCISLMFVTGSFAQGDPPASVKASRTGILLLAHGGSRIGWNEEVRHVADRVDLQMPTEIAFGMANRRTIQDAIDRLVARDCTEVVAVPLFVSSHSSVITSTEYLLHLREKAPEDLAMFAKMDHSTIGHGTAPAGNDYTGMIMPPSADATRPVKSSVPVRMSPALNHDEIVDQILLDRAASVSRNPEGEIVLLVAHGPVPDAENMEWLADMKLLAEGMKKASQYDGIQYLTVRDDADDPVRDAATQNLRQHVEAIHAAGKTALVVPLLLSYGGIEGGIRKRLEGLNYRMPDKGLLPDERIAIWVLKMVQKLAENTR